MKDGWYLFFMGFSLWGLLNLIPHCEDARKYLVKIGCTQPLGEKAKICGD